MSHILVNKINGAFPALDRKKLADPFVLVGNNYIVDLDGPRSAFGYQQTFEKFTPSNFVQEFEVGSELFYFTRDSEELYVQIHKIDWINRQVQLVHQFAVVDVSRPKLNLPWTHALVGTFHYFANRRWGVLRYDPIAKNWTDVTSTIGISDIFFIAESGGRLITLADGITSWSAIDDGMDNTPSPTTGAGFQALSLVGTLEKDTDYLGLQVTPKGYMSLTTKGVLRSELIDSENPFRHVPGEAKQKPLTPWCVIKISDTETVILSRQGLFTSIDGLIFEEWQPLQNEYFKNVEIPPLQKGINGLVSIYYSQARDELYVSFAQNEIAGQYTKAWVLYIKGDSWGSFNAVHRGFVRLDTEDLGTKYQHGYIDDAGKVRFVNDEATSLAISSQNTFGIYIQPLLQYEVFQIEGVNILATNVSFSGFTKIGYPAVPGFYEESGHSETYKTANVTTAKSVFDNVLATDVTVNSGLVVIGKTVQEPVESALNSTVEIGLFRLTDDNVNDQFTLITNVAISCLDVSESQSAANKDDWFNDYPVDVFEDWLAITPDIFEDWGAGVASGSLYTQKIRGSLDGYETFQDQYVDIDEVLIEGKTKFCSCANAGLFNAIELNALNVGESFHAKTLELNGSLIGRL